MKKLNRKLGAIGFVLSCALILNVPIISIAATTPTLTPTVLDIAPVYTVLPGLPNTGFGLNEKNIIGKFIIPISFIFLFSLIYILRTKNLLIKFV